MATSIIQLSRFVWTSLGKAPMFMQTQGTEVPVFWCASETDPNINMPSDIASMPQHQLGGAGRTADVTVNFPQTIWARGAGAVVITK